MGTDQLLAEKEGDVARFSYTKQEIEDLLKAAVDTYKEHVRNVVMDAKEEQDWCDDGTNEYLATLGLELIPKQKKFKFTIPVEGEIIRYYWGVTEEEARAQYAEQTGMGFVNDSFRDRVNVGGDPVVTLAE